MTEQPGSVVESVLRQEGGLVLYGWTGEHPADGSAVAHLILHPVEPGAAERMRLLAEVAQLARGDGPELPDVTSGAAALGITRERGGVWARLHLSGTLVAERAVTEDLAAAAERQGWVVLTVGQDPWDGRASTMDRYLARSNRLHLGRVRLVAW